MLTVEGQIEEVLRNMAFGAFDRSYKTAHSRSNRAALQKMDMVFCVNYLTEFVLMIYIEATLF